VIACPGVAAAMARSRPAVHDARYLIAAVGMQQPLPHGLAGGFDGGVMSVAAVFDVGSERARRDARVAEYIERSGGCRASQDEAGPGDPDPAARAAMDFTSMHSCAQFFLSLHKYSQIICVSLLRTRYTLRRKVLQRK
jgi:hypothetical protein